MTYSTDAQLASLSGLIAALDLEGCTLAGESYGGWLVAAYAARVDRYAIIGGAVGVVRSRKAPPAPRPSPPGELIPVRYNRAAAAAIPGARLVVLPGVGHIPSIDAPRDFVRILTDFAAGRPATA